jgi:hypothetical protein
MMHENGVSKLSAVTSAAGEAIICTVDLRENRFKVTWKKDNFLIAEKVLPHCMRARSLYFASVAYY